MKVGGGGGSVIIASPVISGGVNVSIFLFVDGWRFGRRFCDF